MAVQLTARDIDAISRVVQAEVANIRSSDRAAAAKAVVDTILNRVESTQYPNSVTGVLNQGADRVRGSQFTPVAEAGGSWTQLPRANDYFDQVVTSHARSRIGGAPSTIGGSLNYFNDAISNPRWGRAISANPVARYGTGNATHVHGTAAGARPVTADPRLASIADLSAFGLTNPEAPAARALLDPQSRYPDVANIPALRPEPARGARGARELQGHIPASAPGPLLSEQRVRPPDVPPVPPRPIPPVPPGPYGADKVVTAALSGNPQAMQRAYQDMTQTARQEAEAQYAGPVGIVRGLFQGGATEEGAARIAAENEARIRQEIEGYFTGLPQRSPELGNRLATAMLSNPAMMQALPPEMRAPLQAGLIQSLIPSMTPQQQATALYATNAPPAPAAPMTALPPPDENGWIDLKPLADPMPPGLADALGQPRVPGAPPAPSLPLTQPGGTTKQQTAMQAVRDYYARVGGDPQPFLDLLLPSSAGGRLPFSAPMATGTTNPYSLYRPMTPPGQAPTASAAPPRPPTQMRSPVAAAGPGGYDRMQNGDITVNHIANLAYGGKYPDDARQISQGLQQHYFPSSPSPAQGARAASGLQGAGSIPTVAAPPTPSAPARTPLPPMAPRPTTTMNTVTNPEWSKWQSTVASNPELRTLLQQPERFIQVPMPNLRPSGGTGIAAPSMGPTTRAPAAPAARSGGGGGSSSSSSNPNVRSGSTPSGQYSYSVNYATGQGTYTTPSGKTISYTI